MREWKKYHNKQNYSDCQLIAMVNAYYYLTGKQIDINSKRYEKMVDLVGARHGAAINIKKAHKILGIEIAWQGLTLYPTDKNGEKIKDALPYEALIWHPKYGRHSVLVVDKNEEIGVVRVANFSHATNSQGWMFEEEFRTFVYAAKGDCNSTYKVLRLRRKK